MDTTNQLLDELFGLVPLFRKKFLKPLDGACSLDLTPMETQALFIIYYDSDKCMSEISEELQVSKQQLTKIIKSLEDYGLVVRYQDETNRRFMRTKTTDAGKNICEEIRGTICEAKMQIFKNLSEEEREQLLASIHTIKCLLEREK